MKYFFGFQQSAPIPSIFIMTARRSNTHMFYADLTPINDRRHQDFVDGLRDVFDSADGSKEKEDILNYHIGNKMGSNWNGDVYVKYADALQIAYGQYIGGDCYLKSFECFWRLKSAGAKRMVGIRTALPDTDTPESPHFWVENKGKVFDWGGGQQKIYDKDAYYASMGIRHEKEGNDMGCFRINEYERKLEKASRTILDKGGVKDLIGYIKDCCREDNQERLDQLKSQGVYTPFREKPELGETKWIFEA